MCNLSIAAQTSTLRTVELKATVQTGFRYSIPTPLYVEVIFAIAGILFWMVRSFFCHCQIPVLEGTKHIGFSQFFM
jgi:hypothetical protein